MKVDPAHFAFQLIEADVIKSLEARTGDGSHAVIRNQEVFFPAHKDIFPLRNVLNCDASFPGLFVKRSEGAELAPVTHVRLVIGSPVLVKGFKTIFGADDFALEKCCKCWVILSEA